MIHAGLLAGFSALLGGVIALAAQRRPAVLERTRTFAFAAAAGVVAFHLLPEVLPSQGLAGLLWMAAGFALPWALETGARLLGPRVLRGRGLSGLRVSAEVGFAALIFHSVVEGLALVAALARPGGKLDLQIAIVAHHAPLTAAVVLPFLDVQGPRAAGVRAVLIAVAGVLGALLGGALPGFAGGDVLQAAMAVTAGVLLHVVADEIRAQRFGSPAERALDFAACLAGLAVAGLGALIHLREGAAPLLEMLRVLTGVALACAPAVLVGSVAFALLAARTRFFRWDALLLALVLLGPAAAMAWAALTVVLSLPVAKLFQARQASRPAPAELVAVVRQRAPALLTLMLAAAGLWVSMDSFPASFLPTAALLAVVALSARLDEAGAVAVGAVLIAKGLDPGIAVALLALGPLTRSAVARSLGDRPATAALALLVEGIFAPGAGKLLSFSGALAGATAAVSHALQNLREGAGEQAASSPLGAAAAVVLVGLALATLWSEGVRGWFSPLRHGPRTVQSG
ncbi:MAG TPA: hypothetical protein VMK66_14990 [Myxococcales bacterium]|nr:hypothetical protein [Myxococcales bacterium]